MLEGGRWNHTLIFGGLMGVQTRAGMRRFFVSASRELCIGVASAAWFTAGTLMDEPERDASGLTFDGLAKWGG